VLGLPDPEWGEAVTAFVVLRGAAGEEELIDHCRDRLPSFKVPKRIEQVPGLPRNRAGKLLRDEILP
jgi:acyl-CoA synthetase (AMP-forming)/AMP-acid ligase II